MLRKLLLDKQRDICDRTYVLFCTLGCIALSGIIVANIIAGAWNSTDSLVYVLTDIGLVALLIKSLRSGAITFEPVIASILVSLVFFPYIFISRTGYHADIPVFMVLGFAFNSMVLKRKAKFIMNFVYSLDIILCYLLVHFNIFISKLSSPEEVYIKTATAVGITGFLVAVMVIFQRWIYNKEVDQANEQTGEIRRINEGQSKFFSSMSHEIRTPLNTIIGLNEINLSMDLSDDIEENFRGIKTSSGRLLELINDILDMSKIQSNKMEFVPMEFSLGKILTGLIGKIHGRAIKRSIEFSALIDPDIPDVLIGDEPKVKRLLEALLTYSVAMTERGYVKLYVSFKENPEGKVTLCFEIEDTGAGIRKENIPYIFDMFSRQERFYKNEDMLSGFELALSKSLTEIMGGSITIDSVYGRGTTLKVYLQMEALPALGTIGQRREKESTESSSQDFFADKARVLVVDDEGMNLNVFTNLIKPLGIASDTASSGEEALRLVSENSYDIVFIDHMMPGMDGPSTLEAMKNKGTVPACTVALTANAGNAARKEYLDMGFSEYLSKPVDRKECFELIERLIPDKIKRKSGEQREAAVEKIPMEFGGRKKVNIAITMDSVGDIPGAYPEKSRIEVMPYYCIVGDDLRYRDTSEISIYPLLKAITDKGLSARSAPPSVEEYEGFFMERLRLADQVIHITMAKNVSNGYKNACLAAESFNNVTVVDSGSLSAGMGIQAVYALRMADSGMERDEIITALKDVKNNFGFAFVINDTTNLMRTGRIPKIVHRLCKQLKLRPVVKLKDSKMRISGVLRGNFEKTINDFVEKTLGDNAPAISYAPNEELIILHAGLSGENLEMLWSACKNKTGYNRMSKILTSAPIAANSGCDSYGLLYFIEQNRRNKLK